MLISLRPSTQVLESNVNSPVIWGHWGQKKGHFHQICYHSSMLHSITIRLIHVDQLETLHLCYWGFMVSLGSFGGHSGDLFDFNRKLPQIVIKGTQYNHVTHICFSMYQLKPRIYAVVQSYHGVTTGSLAHSKSRQGSCRSNGPIALVCFVLF